MIQKSILALCIASITVNADFTDAVIWPSHSADPYSTNRWTYPAVVYDGFLTVTQYLPDTTGWVAGTRFPAVDIDGQLTTYVDVDIPVHPQAGPDTTHSNYTFRFELPAGRNGTNDTAGYTSEYRLRDYVYRSQWWLDEEWATNRFSTTNSLTLTNAFLIGLNDMDLITELSVYTVSETNTADLSVVDMWSMDTLHLYFSRYNESFAFLKDVAAFGEYGAATAAGELPGIKEDLYDMIWWGQPEWGFVPSNQVAAVTNVPNVWRWFFDTDPCMETNKWINTNATAFVPYHAIGRGYEWPLVFENGGDFPGLTDAPFIASENRETFNVDGDTNRTFEALMVPLQWAIDAGIPYFTASYTNTWPGGADLPPGWLHGETYNLTSTNLTYVENMAFTTWFSWTPQEPSGRYPRSRIETNTWTIPGGLTNAAGEAVGTTNDLIVYWEGVDVWADYSFSLTPTNEIVAGVTNDVWEYRFFEDGAVVSSNMVSTLETNYTATGYSTNYWIPSGYTSADFGYKHLQKIHYTFKYFFRPYLRSSVEWNLLEDYRENSTTNGVSEDYWITTNKAFSVIPAKSSANARADVSGLNVGIYSKEQVAHDSTSSVFRATYQIPELYLTNANHYAALDVYAYEEPTYCAETITDTNTCKYMVQYQKEIRTTTGITDCDGTPVSSYSTSTVTSTECGVKPDLPSDTDSGCEELAPGWFERVETIYTELDEWEYSGDRTIYISGVGDSTWNQGGGFNLVSGMEVAAHTVSTNAPISLTWKPDPANFTAPDPPSPPPSWAGGDVQVEVYEGVTWDLYFLWTF